MTTPNPDVPTGPSSPDSPAGTPTGDQPGQESEQPTANVPGTATGAVVEGGSQSPPDDEGIPEYEPLTPELVEEEAIRGDFVLKWAVVLLAFLLGSTRIGETATLVHVKTGEYLAAPREDPDGGEPRRLPARDARV